MWKYLVAVIIFSISRISTCAEAKLEAALPAKSLYNVSMQWTDDQERKVELKKWQGRFVVIVMAYTSCGSTCPVTIERLKKIAAAIDDRSDVSFVIVSFDSAQDSPKQLAKYKVQKQVPWDFLAGNEKEIRTLSLLLDIAYEKNPISGEINHSNKIVLLDKQGMLAVTLDGLNADIEPLVDFIKK